MRNPVHNDSGSGSIPRWTWITMITGLVLSLMNTGFVGPSIFVVGGAALLYYVITNGKRRPSGFLSIEERKPFDKLADKASQANPSPRQAPTVQDDVVEGDWRRVDDPINHQDPRPRYIPYPESEEWDRLRKLVYKRDKHTCVNCHKSGVRLNAHHIVPLQSGGSNQLSNLVSVCDDCHAMIHPHLKSRHANEDDELPF